MALAEPLTLHYVVHELPAGRMPFRRWRWELWHRDRLEATGWRVSERDATRSLHRHGARVSRRLLGLPPRSVRSVDFAPLRPGRSVQLRDEGVVFSLVPLQAEGSRHAFSVG